MGDYGKLVSLSLRVEWDVLGQACAAVEVVWVTLKS